ncbi:MAG: TraR/DksA family transcriptional regulator [Alphaproteobacteria bacterium]|nr:TraR/DksA family transcriptional regulator [Alphaproteobacteria bacterium]
MINLDALSSYDPFNDPEYMSEQMLCYFKDKLEKMHKQVLAKEEAISLSLTEAPNREPDPVDQGTNEGLHNRDFMFQEHEDQVRHEIELGLERINEGIYGYCEETGEPIGVKRLLAVPYTRYCFKAQDFKERKMKKIIKR